MKEKIRHIFVDLFRGWALLIMIEVHVFNSMLQPALKTTAWFGMLNFINGLVAPSFLFISGFAFMLSTQNISSDIREFKYPFWKKLGRIVLILLAGYSLHIPILSLRRIIKFYSPDVILRIYNVDILQCIAAGLLLLFVLRLIIKSNKLFSAATIFILLITLFLSPVIRTIDFGKFLPVPAAAYFNERYGSIFPLFPWVGFLLAGATACYYFLLSRESNSERKYILSVFITGVFLVILSYLFPSRILPAQFDEYYTQPLFFFERLGYVLILLAVFWYYAAIRKTKQSFVLDAGRESLLVYWLHLQILYRKFDRNIGLTALFGHRLDAFDCIIFTLILAAAMVLTAKYWGKLKKKYKPLISKLTLLIVTLLILIFLAGF